MLTFASIALSPIHVPRRTPFMVRTEDTIYVTAKPIYFLMGGINSITGIDISVSSNCSCNLKLKIIISYDKSKDNTYNDIE
jgi:hypothetical protein